MRYIRLRIANYRGISEAIVEFARTGITLVHGPNEVGKTSLGEAIWLLFEYPDSSKSHDVSAIKPVHRDAGPEIELEAESGPYRFTYFKRYFKKPETQLTIIKPKRIRAKSSGGPKPMASLPKVGAKNIKPMTLNVPPIKEPKADIPSAGPARPLRAIWYPSRQVTIEPTSPGMFTRIDVVEPPYWAP